MSFWRKQRREPVWDAFSEWLAAQLRMAGDPELADVAAELSEAQLRTVATWLVAPGCRQSVRDGVLKALAS